MMIEQDILSNRVERPRSIGILGGVFDPVHNGHLSVAVLAREHFRLDKILFIPSGTPPHKKATSASAVHRLNMLKLAINNIDGCEVWDGELKREGPSYTIDTLCELKRIYEEAKFYFIMGADNLPEISKWYKSEEIFKIITICVTERPGYDIAPVNIDSFADVKFFPGPHWGASSTIIKEYLKNGYSCKFMMPSGVIKYIIENKLYQ